MAEPQTVIIKRVFLEVLDAPDAEQDKVLERLSPDEGVREAVRRLLEHERCAGGSFLSGTEEMVGGGAAAVRDAPHAPGTQLSGRYRLLERVGEGGFSFVYRGEQLEPVLRTVAIKVLKRGMDSDAIVDRFRAEQQTLAMLNHPNIATVLDAGQTEDGLPFFVMELVNGEPIDRFCARHRLGIQQRIGLMAQAMHALTHAHQRGVIHRDIKPSNILVEGDDPNARVRVIDFGIAKAIAETGAAARRDGLTRDGQFIGTLEYCSPEQARAGAPVDTRSDVYSAASVLYELLSGSVVHADPTALLAGGGGEPPMPSSPSARVSASQPRVSEIATERGVTAPALRRLLRGELDWVMLRALDPNPERRYPTMAAFVDDLERYTRREPVEAGPPSVSRRFRRFVARHRGPAVLATMLIIAVLVGLFGTTAGMLRARANASEARLEAERSLLATASIALESEAIAVAAEALENSSLRGTWAWRHLNGQLDASEVVYEAPLDDRTLQLHAVDRDHSLLILSESSVHRVIGDPADPRFGEIDETRSMPERGSPGSAILNDGEFVLIRNDSGSTALWDVSADQVLWRVDRALQASSPVTDRESASLTVLDAETLDIQRRALADGAVLWSMPLRMVGPVRLDVSPDQRLGVAFDQGTGVQMGVDLEVGQAMWEQRRYSTSASFHANGVLVDSVDHGTIKTLVARTGEIVSERAFSIRGRWGSVVPVLGRVGYVAFDPAGSLTVDGLTEEQNHLVRLRSSRGSIRNGHAFTDGSVAFALGVDGSVRAWRWPMASGTLRRASPKWWNSHGGSVSEDGSLLAQVGWGDVILWDTRTGAPIWRRTVSRFYLSTCSFDAAQERLAVGGWDGRVAVLDVSSGEVLMQVNTTLSSVHALEWSGDGSRLLAGGVPHDILALDPSTGVIIARYETVGSVFALARDDARGGFVSGGGKISQHPFAREPLPGSVGSAEVAAWAWGGRSAVRRWEIAEAAGVVSISINADGERVLIGHADGIVSGVHLDSAREAERLASLSLGAFACEWINEEEFAVGLLDGSIALFRRWGEPSLVRIPTRERNGIHTLGRRACDSAIVVGGSGEPLRVLEVGPSAGVDRSDTHRDARALATMLWPVVLDAIAQSQTMSEAESHLVGPAMDPSMSREAQHLLEGLQEPLNAMMNQAYLLSRAPGRPREEYRTALRSIEPFFGRPELMRDPAYAVPIAITLLRNERYDEAARIVAGFARDESISPFSQISACAVEALALLLMERDHTESLGRLNALLDEHPEQAAIRSITSQVAEIQQAVSARKPVE